MFKHIEHVWKGVKQCVWKSIKHVCKCAEQGFNECISFLPQYHRWLAWMVMEYLVEKRLCASRYISADLGIHHMLSYMDISLSFSHFH